MALRVTVIELPSRYGEPAEALEQVDAILRSGPPSDLVLLPETSLTGYVSPELDFDLTRFGERIDGATAHALAALARKYETHLFGPLILEENAGHGGRGSTACFNATVGFSPRGEHVVTYRKRHPWIPEEWATAGKQPYPLFDVRAASGESFRVTIACCYDVHFLADEATETLDAADLLLFPSAWVEEDEDTRPTRLQEIAQHHRVAVAGANWGRGLLLVPGQGGSCIIDASGEVLAKARPNGPRRVDAGLTVTRK